MASIFIGISSAILGGLLYSILSNSELLKALLNESKHTNNVEIITAVKFVVTVISVFMFLVLVSLRFWLRRVSFLQQVNFERMREIESRLGLWKSWRVHGIDHWEGSHFDKKISSEDGERLLNYKEPKWWSYWKKRQRYARPSGSYYDWLFIILLFAWLLPILLVFWPTGPLWSFIIIIFVWGFLVWYAIRSSKVKLNNKEYPH